MSQLGFLSRVVLDNYKSVRSCDVSLPRLAFLVGANGADKSNFLDSLAFVADSLRFSLAHALLLRGGLGEVQCRFGTRPGGFGMRIEGRLPDAIVRYAFAIRPTRSGGPEVQWEDCLVALDKPGNEAKFYSIRRGCVAETNIAQPPVVARDQLYLVRAAAIEAFRPAYDALASIRVYNLKPDALREPQLPEADPILKRDGSNVAQVLASLEQRDPWFKERIEAYLAVIAPGTVGIGSRTEGRKVAVEFRQALECSDRSTRFTAASMSDGTLRALGLLVAVFQCAGEPSTGPSLLGIEEPELALDPNSIEALADILDEAAVHTQVVAASHSSDLLDRVDIPAASIIVVANDRGSTRIGPLGEADRGALRERAFTAGELIRMNLLRMEPEANALKQPQPKLFDFLA